MIDLTKYNSEAWDREVESGNIWTKPASPELIQKAAAGQKKKIKVSDRSYTFPELRWVLEQYGFKVLLGANPFTKEKISYGTMEFMVVSEKL